MKIVLVTRRKGEKVRTTDFASYAEAFQYLINNQPVTLEAVRFEDMGDVMQRQTSVPPPGEGVNLKYVVATFRAAGLSAKWTKTSSGAPIIAARELGCDTWYVVDAAMWATMESGGGVLANFKNYTALGDFFSISA